MKIFDAGKNRMIELPYGEKNYDDMLSRFHTIPACLGHTNGRKDGQRDGPTELLYQYRALSSSKNFIRKRKNFFSIR